MAVEKVYSLKIEGADSVNDLKEAIEQLNEKLKTLNATSQEYKETLEQLTELQGKLADVMNGISDSASKTNESLDGIKETVESVADSITNLTDAASGDVLDAFANGLAQGMADAAQEAEVLKTNVEEIGGASTVKELKQEISDLRDRLVTLDKGSDEYKATVQELVDAQVKLKEVMNAGKNEVQAAEGSYNALSQRMSALKQVWKETTDEATRNEIGKQINEINTQLKALDASIGNSQRNVGNYKSALDGLDGSFVNWKQELRECKEAMQQLDPSTQAYADAMARAAEITHQMADQQEMIKYSSTDLGDQLNNIRGIATNLVAGYSAVNAAMGLFGEENEDVQKAMLKVQQAMALVQGMQGIDGFIKRTKGLSQSMGLVTKATQANTVATKASAAASQQDAAAKGVEAAATAGAVPAQLSLNAAMEANPIGFIIGLVAALVTGILLLKDKILEMIGANEEMSAAFEKVKAVLAGFGNVIKKSIVNPIKMAIIPIKTLGKLLVDLFTGNWSKMADDLKDGFNEMKDTAIDSINVIGQFKEGYDAKTAEQEEAARKKRAEARSKELDDIIKDNEAKYKSDWKYTEDGKKAYLEYFKNLAEMYDKDSEEYKQALRDKTAYLNDFNEKQKENAENLADIELKLDIARYGEQVKYGQKWYDYEKGLYQEALDLKKTYDDALKEMPPDVKKDYMERLLRWETYLNERNKYLKKADEDSKKEFDKLVNNFKTKFDTLVNESDKALRSTMETVSALTASIKVGGKDYEAIDLYMKEWEKLFRTIGAFDEAEIQRRLQKIRDEITSGAFKNSWETYLKAIMVPLDKSLYEMDKEVKTFITDLELNFEDIKLRFGIDFPQDEVNKLDEIYTAQIENAEEKSRLVRDLINDNFSILASQIAESIGKDISAVTESEVAAVFPTFQKLLDAETNYCNEAERLYNELYQKQSDIWVKYYQNQEKAETTWYSNRLSQMELRYQKENALAERNEAIFDGSNRIAALQREQDYENKTFNEKIEMYQRLRDRYNEMSQDMRLTAEERSNAEAEAAKITGQIIETEMEHTNQLLKIQKEKIKEWRNAIKDAASNINSILSSIGEYWSSMIELERTAIETELESGKINADQAKAREAQNKKSFEDYKTFQETVTLINTIAGAIGAFLQASSSYPPPWGQILGGISAAAVAAAGAVEIAKIRSTQYGSSSTSAGGGGSTNFTLPDVMEYEPSYLQNQTGMDNVDNLNNDGSGNGDGGRAVRAYVVESDVSASQELARKRTSEVTF